ncbi:MAG TPA: hypothetical protein VH369_11755 [Bryobacteraceae bacterium]|jgi:hypothetical protein
MDIESRLSGHWTDDQLIEHLYGVGPEDEHLRICSACQGRLAAAQSARRRLESGLASDSESASYDVLMAQRRRIYARLNEPAKSWTGRWAPALAMLVALAGGLVIYDHGFRQERVSDAQLAREVSCMASDSEPPSIAPLHALFEE